MSNRKLIRPDLSKIKEELPYRKGSGRKVPAEQTFAEEFYYLKQMKNKTPMVVVLQDGEELRGVIEWYDKNCIKVNRDIEPNLLVPKLNIKYIYKQEQEGGRNKRG